MQLFDANETQLRLVGPSDSPRGWSDRVLPMSFWSIGVFRFSRTRRFLGAPAGSCDNETTVSLPRKKSPATMYASCASSRSSSCWLPSEGLTSTSPVRNPREWFNFLEEQQHHAYSGARIA